MYCVMYVLCMQYYALLLYEMSLLKECTLLKLLLDYVNLHSNIYSTGVIHNFMQGLNLQLCNTKEIILNIH